MLIWCLWFLQIIWHGSWLKMRLALVTILNIRMDNCLVLIGLLCSSFVAINRGTNKRYPFSPLGDERFRGVQTGNLLVTRTLGFGNFREWIGGSRAYCILKWYQWVKRVEKYVSNAAHFLGGIGKSYLFLLMFISLLWRVSNWKPMLILKIMPKHGGNEVPTHWP